MKQIIIAFAAITLLFAANVNAQDYTRHLSHLSADKLISGEHSAVIWDNLFTWGGDTAGPWGAAGYLGAVYQDQKVILGKNDAEIMPCFIGSLDTLISPWIPIGYSTQGAASTAQLIQILNPQVFTLRLQGFSSLSDADSVVISEGWFELADDTTRIPQWAADSSNIFIRDGAYGFADYRQGGIYEPILEAADSLGYDFVIRAQAGGYIRFILVNTDTPDSVFFRAQLWGEN